MLAWMLTLVFNVVYIVFVTEKFEENEGINSVCLQTGADKKRRVNSPHMLAARQTYVSIHICPRLSSVLWHFSVTHRRRRDLFEHFKTNQCGGGGGAGIGCFAGATLGREGDYGGLQPSLILHFSPSLVSYEFMLKVTQRPCKLMLSTDLVSAAEVAQKWHCAKRFLSNLK